MDEAAPLATVSFEAITESDAAERLATAPTSMEGAPSVVAAIEHVLAPIIQSAPDGAAAIAQRGRYLVEFSAEGRAGIESGAVKFLQRANGRLQPTLVNEAHQIQEHGVLAGRAAQGIARAAAVAHVVVLVAVQAQLVTMERTLERIEKKVDGLRKALDDEKIGLIRGRLRTLAKLRDDLATSEWTSDERTRWQTALDQADTEFHQVEEFARRQCDDATQAIERAPVNASLFGSSGKTLAADLRNEAGRYRHHYDLLLLCLVGRFVVAHLRKGFRAQLAADDLHKDLDHAAMEAGRHEELVVDRAMAFTTKFMSAANEGRTRKGLRDEAVAFNTRSHQSLDALREQLLDLRADTRRPVRALVEVGAGGSVRNVRLLG